MYGTTQPPVVRQPVKKLLDDPPGGVFKKVRDDAPVMKRLDDPPPFKKFRDDGLQGRIKKVTDDVRQPFPFPRPPIRPLGGRLAPFLLTTGHHADLAGAGEAADVVAVGDVLVEVVLPTRRDVLQLDGDEQVAVLPALLMPQSDGVPDLVDAPAGVTPGAEGNVLLTPAHTDR